MDRDPYVAIAKCSFGVGTVPTGVGGVQNA